MSKPKVIAVVGPTASGKSALGIYLAQHLRVGAGLAKKLGGEVISADSRQVYKGLDIGTGKVTKREMQGVPHHLLSIASPKKQFSADDFVKKAERACSNILQNNRIPIVVGGTGFYIDALLGRLSLPNVPPNPKLRAQLEKKSVEALYAMLKQKDRARAKTIEPKHKRRIIRALEIIEILGVVPSINDLRGRLYDVLWLGLSPAPATLKKNIHKRLLARIKSGMIAEAKKLHNPPAGGGLSYKRMEELGLEYRYLARLLQNKITKKEFEVELEREINKYAKRQMRWFKRNKDIRWIKSQTEALRLVKEFFNY
ncbi:MAG: tRNA (adenosine(37)-N6)-dimethylallyltransferase MiaA [Candidatus Adlerbacteria bacterium]|nr:tRNA (adenosine(37)-N6)-dimethylallyltransferase MiaA [Candidatus Adlerbacteria bacterium]MDZ4225961.1 tRNA (adenosine(37)-N6)-dimethylallyltransferase MiaA [Patescibacteria group bacterium]